MRHLELQGQHGPTFKDFILDWKLMQLDFAAGGATGGTGSLSKRVVSVPEIQASVRQNSTAEG